MCRTSSSVTTNPHACSTISPAANNGKSTTLNANINDAEILIGHMLPTAVKLAVRGLPISAADVRPLLTISCSVPRSMSLSL